MTDTIVVLTHNGKMPSEGGIRLGYRAGNREYRFNGPPEGYLLRSSVPAPKPVEEQTGYSYASTAMLRGEYPFYNVVCPRCKMYNSIDGQWFFNRRDFLCRYCPHSFDIV